VSATDRAKRVVFVIYPNFQSLDLTGPFEVFAGANEVLIGSGDTPRYRLSVAAAQPGLVNAESGLNMAVDATLGSVRGPIDTLVVVGGRGSRQSARNDGLVSHVQRLARRSQRVASICSGAYVLAAAGLLDGRTVCTHWSRTADLARKYPRLVVDENSLYRCDGNVWTSAGVTAGIDMALAMVEQDHDAQTAQLIARGLVMFLRRPGGQSQFAAAVWHDKADNDAIRRAQAAVVEFPGSDLRINALARLASMSERNFVRVFHQQVGTTPAKYVESVRFDMACRLLETTDDGVDLIAQQVGLGTAETMRRVFLRRRGVSPTDYRQRFSLTA
jgi:transcriptional regulator GlxA family with amidase domain